MSETRTNSTNSTPPIWMLIFNNLRLLVTLLWATRVSWIPNGLPCSFGFTLRTAVNVRLITRIYDYCPVRDGAVIPNWTESPFCYKDPRLHEYSKSSKKGDLLLESCLDSPIYFVRFHLLSILGNYKHELRLILV